MHPILFLLGALGAHASPATTPAATAAPVPQNVGHCTPAETAFFDCDVGRGKRLSVCGTEDGLQYRFGKVGAPELTYPPAGAAGGMGFTVEGQQTVRSEGTVLAFRNGDVRYEVTSMSGGGCCSEEEAAANNFVGVYVFKAEGYDLLATVACRGTPTDRLAELVGGAKAPASH